MTPVATVKKLFSVASDTNRKVDLTDLKKFVVTQSHTEVIADHASIDVGDDIVLLKKILQTLRFGGLDRERCYFGHHNTRDLLRHLQKPPERVALQVHRSERAFLRRENSKWVNMICVGNTNTRPTHTHAPATQDTRDEGVHLALLC